MSALDYISKRDNPQRAVTAEEVRQIVREEVEATNALKPAVPAFMRTPV